MIVDRHQGQPRVNRPSNSFGRNPRRPWRERLLTGLRPRFDLLEERVVLSPTIYVVNSTGYNTLGSGTSGTLPYVLSQANANSNSAGSVIEFDGAVFASSSQQTITLGATLVLSETDGPEVIDGPGAGVATISGDGAVGVFEVQSGVTATISGLTISGGKADDGGGLANYSAATLNDCGISGNAASFSGGGVASQGATATLTLTACTINGNSAQNGAGLDNDNASAATLTDCTITGNTAATFGGGIDTSYGTNISLTSCTITGNFALLGGGAYIGSSNGTATLNDNIVAGNTSQNDDFYYGDIFGGENISGSYNLFGTGGSGDLENGSDGNIVLTSLAGLDLSPLGNYGGPTPTVALLPGSVAIGAGTAESGVTTDQRGVPLDSPPDIGAFQSGGFTFAAVAGSTSQQTTDGTAFANPIAVIVTANNPLDPVAGGTVNFTAPSSGASAAFSSGTATIGAGGVASVVAANNSIAGSYSVTASAVGAAPISLDLTNLVSAAVTTYTVNSASGGLSGSGTSGTLPFVVFLADADASPGDPGADIQFDSLVFSTPQTITLGATLVLSRIEGPLVIDGPSKGQVTISGGGTVRVFEIESGVTATISGLTISRGSTTGNGGGLENYGAVTLTDCTISGNSAGDGGGLWSGGTATLTDCTIAANVASFAGGGLEFSTSSTAVTITSCTVTGNTADLDGGLDNYGPVTATLNDTIVAGNNYPSSFGGASDIGGYDDISGTDNLIGIGGSADLQNGVDGNIVLTSLAGLGLAPLADYGGPTETVALLPGSVAIGAGTAESGVTTDQRGLPLDSPIDIGAFQSQGFTLTVAAGSTPQQTTNGTAFANPLAVTVTAKNPNEPVAGGTVTFTAPSSGASAALTAGTVTLGVDGTASIIAADNSIAGSYSVTASTGGAGVVSFHLTNLVSSQVNNYFVNSTSSGFSGSGTSGTLPYVLFLVNADANAAAGGIEVQFTNVFSTPQTINVGATLVLSQKSVPVVIAGPGAGLVTLNGGGVVEVFDFDAMVTATISGLSIVNGDALSGGGIYNDGTLTISDCSIEDNQSTGTFDGGGGIDNAGVLTIEQSLITGNSASNSGDGGGILNNGVLTIDQSQITGNSAYSGGGLASASGMATIMNSLFSSNGASEGGAIQDGSNMTIVNSTIVSNVGQNGGGINSYVGGDDNTLLLTIEDCTIVGNVGDDLDNGDQPDPVIDIDVGNSIFSNVNADITSQGHNIIQHSAEGMGFVATDLLNVNPLLGPLQNNGGPTLTEAPLPGSPAIDAGDNALIPAGVATDQRGAGYPRIVNYKVDIGAFEVQAGFHFVVTAQPPGSVTAGTGFGLTVTAENSSGAVDSSISGTVTVAIDNNPGGATLGGVLTATAQAGVAVFSGLTIDQAATGYTLIVSGSGETGPATNTFNVTAAAATQLVVTSQPPQYVVAGKEFGPVVSAEDPFGNVDPTFDGSVSLALLANPGGATLGGTLSMAAQSGVADFTGLTLDQAGTGYTLQASASGLTPATTNAITVEVPTVYTVDLTSASGAGTGNDGDLVYVVGLANANTNPAGSVIEFDPSVFSTPQTITLSSTLMLSEAAGPVMIDGPGAGVVMVSGNNTTEVFNIALDTVVSMSGLSIIDGNGTFGGGLFNAGTLTITNSTFTGNSALYGGAIYTRNGTLTLNDDTFSSNSASAESGAVDNWAGGTVTVTSDVFTGNSAPNGGAIGNEWGSVSVSNSTFSNNLASTGAGGAIINYNPSDGYSNSLSVVDCTISGNAAVNGGGIASGGPDTLSLTNDTITGNSVTGTGGGLYDDGTTTLIACTVTGNSAGGGGGGIANTGGALKIGDTIVAENTATTGGPDAQGDSVTSLGNNLVGEIDGSSGWIDSDLTGTSARPLDPLLAPLGDYGGPTETIALLPGSPAIGAGTAVSGITTDQRGFPLDSPPDIGAFQTITLVVNTTSDAIGSPPGELSLRQAIDLANALGGNETITFDPTVFATSQTITLTQGQLELDDTSGTVTIEGPAAGVTISGGGQSRVFQIDNGVTAVLSGLTISGGSTTGNGGGIYDDGGTVTISDCTVSGNTGNMGGGVFTTKLGTISITGCSLTGGSAGSGGGLYNDGGTVKLTDSTVNGNTGNMGGGVFNSKLGTIAITGCTMSGNSAADGGALYNSGTATLSASTIGATRRRWVVESITGPVAAPRSKTRLSPPTSEPAALPATSAAPMRPVSSARMIWWGPAAPAESPAARVTSFWRASPARSWARSATTAVRPRPCRYFPAAPPWVQARR